MSAITGMSTPIASNAASLGAAQNAYGATAAAATAPAPGAGSTPAAPAGNAAVSTGFDPTPVTGGGAVTDFLKDSVSKMINMASSGKENLEKTMAADTAANGGKLDAAKVQQYTSQLSTYDNLTALAKKLQDSKDQSIQVWLR